MTINNEYRGLRGRVVIITGAGQGIGRVYAHNFAAQGAIPIVAELNAEAGQKVVREIEAKGGRALAVQTDVIGVPWLAVCVWGFAGAEAVRPRVLSTG